MQAKVAEETEIVDDKVLERDRLYAMMAKDQTLVHGVDEERQKILDARARAKAKAAAKAERRR